MSTTLDNELPFLDTGELLATASSVDAIYTRTVKTIERLQRDVETQKTAIARKWSGSPLVAGDRARIEGEETRVALLAIRANAEKELDGLLVSAGAAHARAISQRPFYSSPVMTLNRLTLGDPKRSAYMEQTASIGPAEAAHLGQWAVSTKNKPLAAALVTRLDSMPIATRPFGAAALAGIIAHEEHHRATEAIKIAEARFQAVVIAIRSWKADRNNPFDTLALAMRGRTLDEKVLRQLEGTD